MTSTFHIRDKLSGQYYSKFVQAHPTSELVFSTRGYGKAFKDLGKLKTHLLFVIGISVPPKEIQEKEGKLWTMNTNSAKRAELNDEVERWHALHPGYRSIPDWLYNRSPLEKIPDTLEIVNIKNKDTKDIEVIDFDPYAYTEESKRLRLLTDSHGSAVRDVYKKLEKTSKIKDFKYVIAIRVNLDNHHDQSIWRYNELVVDTKKITETLEQMQLERNEMIRSSNGPSVAIAFKDQETAVWFSLSYNGNDTISLLDIEKLEEIVRSIY